MGIFLCPGAGVNSNWKTRLPADISNRPRYSVVPSPILIENGRRHAGGGDARIAGMPRFAPVVRRRAAGPPTEYEPPLGWVNPPPTVADTVPQ